MVPMDVWRDILSTAVDERRRIGDNNEVYWFSDSSTLALALGCPEIELTRIFELWRGERQALYARRN